VKTSKINKAPVLVLKFFYRKSSANRTMTQPGVERVSFAQVLSHASRRAHEQANQKTCHGRPRIVWASVAAAEKHDLNDAIESVEWLTRIIRWGFGAFLLPLCWVTSWTLLSRFSDATVDQDFWRTAEFWYFAVGVLLMLGWFLSGFFQSFFLYIYVLGHELTHAIFVLLHFGKVTDFHVSAEGGYITTNKTNLLIALSPYFVPFWAVVAVIIYALIRYLVDLQPEWNRVLYGVMGITWAFHMLWTVWMIPRDQPDLKENGTFFSLVVIYFANLVLLALLLCLAGDSPLQKGREFVTDWLFYATSWSQTCWNWVNLMVEHIRLLGRF
jgi:hypothetical protein